MYRRQFPLISFLLLVCVIGLSGAQTVGAPVPSNYIADVGQAVAFNAVVTGANVPFIAKLENSTATINTITGSSNGLITFGAITSKAGQTSFNVVITDQTPTTFNSATNTITVNPAPTATSLTPSNAVLQPGWTETYSVVLSGGTGPFTVELRNTSTVVNTISGASSGTVTFNSFTPPTGTDSYYVLAWDNGTAPDHFAFNSSANTIISKAAATATRLTPSNSPLDISQYVVYNVLVSNGIGPFTVNLILNSNTVNTITISNTALAAASGIVTFGANVPPLGADAYNVVVTDTGNSPAYVFASPSNTIVVSNTLNIGQTVKATNTTIDIGQTAVFNTTALWGSQPRQGYWYYTSPANDIAGINDCNIQFKCTVNQEYLPYNGTVKLLVRPISNTIINTTFITATGKSYFELIVNTGNTILGTWSFSANIIDGASIPENAISLSNSVTIHQLNITMSRSCTYYKSGCAAVQQGSSVTFNGAVSGGAGGPFTYQWYERPQNGTFSAISGATSNTYTFKTSNSTTLGSWNFTLQVTDKGTTTPFVVNSSRISFNLTKNTSTSTTTTMTTTSTATTSTPQSGGGGGGSGGGGGGGGGGSFGPTLTHFTNSSAIGVYIYNLSQKNSESITINGTEFNLTENFITPTSAGITIDGTPYTLYTGEATNMTIGGEKFYINMTGLSYLPIIDTVTIKIYQGLAPPGLASAKRFAISINSSTASVTVNLSRTLVPYVSFDHGAVLVTLTTANSTGVTTSFNISNVTATVPPAPSNYTKIIAVNVSVAASDVGLNATIAYPCSIHSGDILPYALKNKTWLAISSFKVNSGACTVSLAIPQDPVIGLMYFSGGTGTGSGSGSISNSNQSSIPGPSVIGYAIVVAVIVIIGALAAHIIMTRRRHAQQEVDDTPIQQRQRSRRAPPPPPASSPPVQNKPKKYVPLTKRYRDDIPLQSMRDDKK